MKVSRLLAAVALIAAMGTARPAAAAESFWREAGIGAGAGFSNLLYVPAKAIYAGVGAVVGGVAWCVTGGDLEVANGIWNSSMNGTWVVTPGMLQGKEKIHFNAPPQPLDAGLREYDAAPAAPSAPAGEQGYGEPAPRYDDPGYGSGGSGWH